MSDKLLFPTNGELVLMSFFDSCGEIDDAIDAILVVGLIDDHNIVLKI